jgi:hypothetical protein
MKNTILTCFLLVSPILSQGQNKAQQESVTITSQNGPNQITKVENGQISVNVNAKDILKYKKAGLVRYSDFGAKGDGKTDDIDAIAATHAAANLHGLRVKADDAARYYISGKERTAVIRTDTDFGKAAFIISH